MYSSRYRPKTSQPTRDRIIESVRELLSEGAFHESTVEEVAARAGVWRATLKKHKGSRRGLDEEMFFELD